MRSRLSPAMPNTPKGWHSRGYLPHFDGGEIIQFITFRLVDSLPAVLFVKWQEEIKHLKDAEQKTELRKRIELFLDTGYGGCHLRDERIASLVQSKLLDLHEQSYRLIAWVIMPNHAHLLLRPLTDNPLSTILKKIKGSTAREANKILGRSGRFWQKEYFDRYIRNEKHFHAVFNYIESNPVKAHLCAISGDWKFSSAYYRKKD